MFYQRELSIHLHHQCTNKLIKNRNINFSGLFLLLLYLFCNSPSILFHHHENNVVTYAQADMCEKAIYYADKEGTCKHKQHITSALEKCSLCDNHTVSTHVVSNPIFEYINTIFTPKHNTYNINFYTSSTSENFDRGPPFVYSL